MIVFQHYYGVKKKKFRVEGSRQGRVVTQERSVSSQQSTEAQVRIGYRIRKEP